MVSGIAVMRFSRNCVLKSRVGMLLNSITHYALHHEKYRANFGLYFNVWDRLMKTNHLDYEKRYDLATGTPPSKALNPSGGSGGFRN